MVTASDPVMAERTGERDYPSAIAPVNHVEPVPRRIRAFLAGELVLDTTSAHYMWEWPYYPSTAAVKLWVRPTLEPGAPSPTSSTSPYRPAFMLAWR